MTAVSLRSLFEFSSGNVRTAFAERRPEDGAPASTATTFSDFALERAKDQLNQAIDVDVFELFAGAWVKFKQVRDCANPATHPPGQDTIVTMHDVEVTSSNSPLLHTKIGEVPLPDLRFTLDLTAKFEAIQLVVRDAHVRAIKPGAASAIVKLKYGNTTLAEKATPQWQLPDAIWVKGAGQNDAIENESPPPPREDSRAR